MEEQSLSKEPINSDLAGKNNWKNALKKKQIIIGASIGGGVLILGLIILIIVLATRSDSKKVFGEINCVYNIESSQKTLILGSEYVKKPSKFDIYIDNINLVLLEFIIFNLNYIQN